MIDYKDAPIELVPDPEALDLAIQTMQEKLSTGLPWLQKAFGRALIQAERPTDAEGKPGREIVVPYVFYKREAIPVQINDNLKAFCFFVPKDPLEFTDWQSLTSSTNVVQPLAIIFWLNLQRIDPTKQYNFSETLRADVVRILKRCTDFVLLESSAQPDRVFSPFTITETFRQYMKPPYAAFRFDGTLHFDYSTRCVETAPPVVQSEYFPADYVDADYSY